MKKNINEIKKYFPVMRIKDKQVFHLVSVYRGHNVLDLVVTRKDIRFEGFTIDIELFSKNFNKLCKLKDEQEHHALNYEISNFKFLNEIKNIKYYK